MPTREDAWKLLCEYTASESLRKHMLAVEACVRAYARKAGADEELWGIAALLHDFDYERWPNQEHLADQGHPSEGAKVLRERATPRRSFARFSRMRITPTSRAKPHLSTHCSPATRL